MIKILSGLLLFLLFAFYFPRFLIENLGKENPWASYLYHYGFGFLYTGSGLWIAFKTRACDFTRPKDRLWFGLIILGFVYFAGLHGYWTYKALQTPSTEASVDSIQS